MTDDPTHALSSCKKKRGTVKASLTRIGTRLDALERSDDPSSDEPRRLTTRLESLVAEFKVHHYAVIDLIDDEEELETQQAILDEHDDFVATLASRLEKLSTVCSSRSSDEPKKALKRLKNLERGLKAIKLGTSTPPTGEDGICLLQQYTEQITEIKAEFADIRRSILTFDVDDDSELDRLLTSIEKDIFDLSLAIKKLLRAHAPPSVSSLPDPSGVKLPKLDVPTFDGNILNWKTFWEQFDVSVHSRTNLTETEKLAYLRHALKDGSAKTSIEGLSRSGDHYNEALTCLKSRFNRPRLIHQAHVQKILDVPNLKDGTGRELRRLHDVAQQHLRALKALGHEPSGSFITSLLELKLDVNTMFEWQRHSQASHDVPHYKDLLEFINLRAQASETSLPDSGRKSFKAEPAKKSFSNTKPVASFAASADASSMCVVCKTDKHPLYACSKFKSLSHDDKRSTLKSNRLCINCLKPGHIVRNCKSLYHCRVCQRPHHTLLHLEAKSRPEVANTSDQPPAAPIMSSHAATGIKSNLLLMTCSVQVEGHDGSSVKARALLDSGSSASFISERLTQNLRLPRYNQNTKISGVVGFTHSSVHPITTFRIFSEFDSSKKFSTSAVVVPRVTCDLPLHNVPFDQSWSHLTGLQLADPEFGQPGRIDLLLGVEIFAEVMLQGRRTGPVGSPIAFETQFGWVLSGCTSPCTPTIASHHVAILTGDDLLRRFWEIEEKSCARSCYTLEERAVLDHFESHHSRLDDGRFEVPLLKKSGTKSLGESRSQAVRRFISFERSLHLKGHFSEFKAVIDEYFDSGHAELVPDTDLHKSPDSVYYLPIHMVMKESSTTTKIRAVFDASSKTSSGVSLNDLLLVGPTVHSSLIDVLLRFRLHRVALIADVSRMYRAIALVDSDRDLHRFIWRNSPDESLEDCRMTRLTFGVSASSFIANMCVKQNALDSALEFPLAAKAVEESFYVDDGLTGADSVEKAIELYHQLQALFAKGGFLLRKWNSSEEKVLQHIDPKLREQKTIHPISDPDEYAKTLGIGWNSTLDHFRLTVTDFPSEEVMTKRLLTSDIAKTFDALGWFSPVVVIAKILLQRVWEERIQWDEPVPQEIQQTWLKWRSELSLITGKCIPRCYFPKNVSIVFWQLHGFCDASELAYAGVVYVRMMDSTGSIHTSLVVAKTKVAPLKKLSIPRLELCGAYLLSQLLQHCQSVFGLPTTDIFAWTDSTIVLNWISGNPRRFKTYVANRVTNITEAVPPSRWNHVEGILNPADCASRGMFPSELLTHELWWGGPPWLRLEVHQWPQLPSLPPNCHDVDADEVLVHMATVLIDVLIPFDRSSRFEHLARVTAWICRFAHNCRSRCHGIDSKRGSLSSDELNAARLIWIRSAQAHTFQDEIQCLRSKKELPKNSSLRPLRPFLDGSGLLRVGGRLHNSQFAYAQRHPLILCGKHCLTKLIIRDEHLRLLHAGETLVNASLGRRFHIVGQRSAVRSITRACVQCRRTSARPQPPAMGQLPQQRIAPGIVFENVGIDYAGPVYIKLGKVRKPVVVKAYICLFVAMSVKAVHVEAVSDLSSSAFIACLRRFISRRGKPYSIWSDHGTNFVGASRELKDLAEFLEKQKSAGKIPEFCASQGIRWNFIPERAPHFGGLWESAVKSVKTHLRRVMGNVKFTFEELSTVLTQIEACLNSRPLASLPCEGEGIEVLTPGHFLIGRPLEALPDSSPSPPVSKLRRWVLTQSVVRHFWKRWSSEYFCSLRKFSKWHFPTRNLQVNDIVVLRDESFLPTKWPMGRITEVHCGADGVVRVVTVKTATGIYRRPAVKVALLFQAE